MPLLALVLAAALAAAPPARTYTGDLVTRWGRAVTPANAWRSYPRPQFERARWLNLNGSWDYAITPAGAAAPARMDGAILVPFPVESRLSGVARPLLPNQRLWYRRTFTVPADWAGQRVMLNFGAVDHEAQVRVNGVPVGAHRGGYDAWGLDVTDALRPGANALEVAVTDPTSAGAQARGKQSLTPSGIWYTAASGIWQTVWLEPVPALRLADVRLAPDIDRGVVEVAAALNASAADTDAVRITVTAGGRPVATRLLRANRRATIPVPHAHLWSPDDPYLYEVTAELVTVADPYAGVAERDRAAYDARFTAAEAARYAAAAAVGPVRDRVATRFGMRKVAIGPGPVAGQPAILLNNRPLFQHGTLDQGWWPDGLVTPPSEEAMRSDLLFLKAAGFNMLRKHIKVEPARFYDDADRLGLLVWQDMPSGGNEDRFVAGSSQGQAVFPAGDMADQQRELSTMVLALANHPSVVTWVVNNEGWGQYDAATLARLVKGLDPTRLVDATSGWLDTAPGASDLYDLHTYEDVPHAPGLHATRAVVLGEYGGIGLPVPGHIWRPGKGNWGYQTAADTADYLRRFRRKLDEVARQARLLGLSAAVYTQTSDVEDELNGLLTFDRAVPKAPVPALAAAAAALRAPPAANNN